MSNAIDPIALDQLRERDRRHLERMRSNRQEKCPKVADLSLIEFENITNETDPGLHPYATLTTLLVKQTVKTLPEAIRPS